MASLARTVLIRGALLAVGLPVVIVAVAAATFRLLNVGTHPLTFAGQTRRYLLHVPSHYDRGRAFPLVVSLHGAAMWPALMARTTQWDDLADRDTFFVAYPAGTGILPVWLLHAQNDEFIFALIDTVRAAYGIDTARVFVDGFSNGAGMAFALSCARPRRIAAVAAVAGAQLLPWEECADSTPVPLIAFHGTADPLAPYAGGKTWVTPRPLPNIASWVAAWARRNRCGSTPIDTAVAPDVTRRTYVACAPNAPVVFYTIRGGGHQWPGGRPMVERWLGPMSRTVDATSLSWTFFRDHPLRTPR